MHSTAHLPLGFSSSLVFSKANSESHLKGTSRYNEEKMNNGKDIFTEDKRRVLNPCTEDTPAGEFLLGW